MCISPEITLGSLILHNQSFSAEIPEAYLMALQSNLTRGDSEIDYIGEIIRYSSLNPITLNLNNVEPDSVVTTQLA
jgi:hypothetical protein